MANDYRDRDRFRGMFGYEGEGFMRGRDDDFDRGGDHAHGGWRDRGGDRGVNDRGYRSVGNRDFSGMSDRGPRNLADADRNESDRGYGGGFDRFGERSAMRNDFRPNEFSDFNRGDSVRGGPRSESELDRERPSYRGRGPKGYQRSDDRIREDVCERLEHDDRVDASDIEVRVEAGVVILSGTVEDRLTKRRAEDVVESIRGVKDVQNQLRLESGRANDRA